MYPFPEGTKPEDFATKERFPHLKNTHYHAKNNFLWVDTVVGGTIPGNFMPAIEKGFLEKIAIGRGGRLPGAKHLRRGAFRQRPPGRFQRNGISDRRPQGVCRTCSAKSRPSLLEPIVKLAHHGARRTKWATCRAIFRAAAAKWSAWIRPAAA